MIKVFNKLQIQESTETLLTSESRRQPTTSVLLDSVTWVLPNPKPTLAPKLEKIQNEPRQVFKMTTLRLAELLQHVGDIVAKGRRQKSADFRLDPKLRVHFKEDETVKKLGPPPPTYTSWWQAICHIVSIMDAYDLKIENQDHQLVFLKMTIGTVCSQGFMTADEELFHMLPEPGMAPDEFKWAKNMALWRLDDRMTTRNQPNRFDKNDVVMDKEGSDYRYHTTPLTGSVFNRTPLFWLDPKVSKHTAASTVLLLSFTESNKGEFKIRYI